MVLALAVVVTGCSSSAPDEADGPAVSSTAPVTSLPPLPDRPAPLATSATSAPVRVQVPAIGVDSTLESLGLLADGELASPTDFPVAGWYAGGVRPGDPGPAIVAGHIDSVAGPAVFYDLGALERGDPVVVTRADGTVVRFTVESKAQYAKAKFPTDAVYGPTPTPELRLITCTGAFDRSARSYEDNLVVTAVLAS